ncbi:MAG TPA: hypothetical protein PLG57_12775 [Bacteroidia bacterium]|jgi:hypothetical protein|nr:hypothetical protein [Bacteroidia bacterium]
MKDDSTFIYDHISEEEKETTEANEMRHLGSFRFIVEELLILSTLFIMLQML